MARTQASASSFANAWEEAQPGLDTSAPVQHADLTSDGLIHCATAQAPSLCFTERGSHSPPNPSKPQSPPRLKLPGIQPFPLAAQG